MCVCKREREGERERERERKNIFLKVGLKVRKLRTNDLVNNFKFLKYFV
jgi:hypothetical protein